MTKITLRRKKSSHPHLHVIVSSFFLACFLLLLYMYMTLHSRDNPSLEKIMSTEDERAEPFYEEIPSRKKEKRRGRSTEKGDTHSAATTSDKKATTLPLVVESKDRDFLGIGQKTGTDKVEGVLNLPHCLVQGEAEGPCPGKDAKNKFCRPRGHFYHTIYNKHLRSYSRDDAAPFQFLEIGFFNGQGFDAYMEFLPKGELHSMEISCIGHGPREEGKWPWGNFAERNPKYKELLAKNRLHCGDASDVQFLDKVWKTDMKRKNAPPLKVVIDDASHLAGHMVQTMFYWFPRIEPRGILVVEDIQPTTQANEFRTQFLPQIMSDLHYCGGPDFPDKVCFPTLQPLLASIHCEMHICVFERNDEPAVELDLTQSRTPANALDLSKCGALKKQ